MGSAVALNAVCHLRLVFAQDLKSASTLQQWLQILDEVGYHYSLKVLLMVVVVEI